MDDAATVLNIAKTTRPTQPPLADDEHSESSEGLVWPAPVSDSDILWLDGEADSACTPREPATGLAVSQLLAAGASIEWHDAVALVAQLADEVVSEATRPAVGAIPSLDAVWLEPDGRVHVTLDPHRQEPIVAGCGRVLQALCQGRQAPANLRLLVWGATSGTGAKLTLDDLMVELARWERPGRVAKLVSLYERARAAATAPGASAPASGVSSPVPGVSSPMPGVSPSVPGESSPMPGVSPPMPAVASPMPAVSSPVPVDISAPAVEIREPRRAFFQPLRVLAELSERQIAITVVGIVWCLVAVGIVAWRVARWGDAAALATSAAAGEVHAPVGVTVPELPQSPVETAREATTSPAEQSPIQNPGRVALSRLTRQPARDAFALATPREVIPDDLTSSALPTGVPLNTPEPAISTRAPLGTPEPAVSTRVPVGVPESAMPTRVPSGAQVADARATSDRRLYGSDDQTVTEPVLVKPRLLLPRPSETPESELGVLELVIDESGRVESVHLKSPANRYREKWWLFSAKEWQFEPARKQGRPVRFLKRIPLTDLNTSEPQ